MILGKICTRSCRFCAVQSGREGEPPREDEGERIARAAEDLGLSYAVITSVDRDDLPDKGAGQFALVLRALKTRLPGVRAEVLVPDYTGEELAPIAAAGPDVLAHNVETVRSLQRVRDPRASFDRSLACLSAAGKMGLVTKTSILLGLGERPEELYEAMDELAAAGVDALVLGQYLQPTARQIPPREYISPGQFERYAEEARRRGFRRVISSPFARTSYHAAPL
jgi:lipoic acid synthetase